MPRVLLVEEFLRIGNLKDTQQDTHNPAVVIVRIAAIGDIVACEPVIRFAKKRYPKHSIVWILHRSCTELLLGHPLLDYIVPVDNLDCATKIAQIFAQNPKEPAHRVINLHFTPIFCKETQTLVVNDNNPEINAKNYYHIGSLLEAFSVLAGLPKLSDQPLFFTLPNIRVEDLPEHFIVVHCRARDSLRNWENRKWQKLFYYFAKQHIHVVEIGLKPCISSKSIYYHDRTEERSLQRIAAIIQKADFFIGIDSGFAHIANALMVDGLVIMGSFYTFTAHIPYTGFYATKHIVRNPNGPASEVSVEAVCRAYEERL